MNYRKILAIPFIILTNFPQFSSSFDIWCDIKEVRLFSKKENECKVYESQDFVKPNMTLQSIKGRDNSKVAFTSIRFPSKLVAYLPVGINNFAENLIALIVEDSKMVEITQSDMKQFPQLLLLQLTNNHIEVLGEDLFKYNPELIEIILKGNRLKEIADHIFENLKNLKGLNLEWNTCISSIGFHEVGIMRVLDEIEEFCAPMTPEWIEKRLKEDDLFANAKESEFLNNFLTSLAITTGGLIIVLIFLAVAHRFRDKCYILLE